MLTIIKPMLFILLVLRWEFIKENKKVRKQELDQERDEESKKKERKQDLEQESDGD